MSTRKQFEWVQATHPNYFDLVGYKDAMVRHKPSYNGRFVWSFGKVWDHADTVDEAKEMVEGLALIEGRG